MYHPFKKRPGATLVIIIAAMYACIIGGWAGFIIMANSRNTTKLSHDEAVQLYKECLARKANSESAESQLGANPSGIPRDAE